QLDEEGKKVEEEAGDQDGVIIVEAASTAAGVSSAPDGQSPDVKLTKAQKAALKVAAMAKEDDQPKLIDVDEPKRLTQKGKAARGAGGAAQPKGAAAKASKAPAKSESKKTSPPPTEDVAPVAAPEAKSTKPKLRMRLV